jgi:hypothetical protein
MRIVHLNGGTFSTQVENGQQEAFWDYWGYSYIKVYFDGDFTVGKKTNGKVAVKFSWSYDAPPTIYTPVDVEIIKNDGSHVWGIMSMVKDNYLHYGHFCVKL